LLRLRFLVAEALDEPLESHEVRLNAVGIFLRVHHPRRFLAAPRVPRSGEERAAACDDFEGRGCDRLEEPTVMRDQDHRGVE